MDKRAKTLGQRIQAFRNAAGYTQDAFGKMIGRTSAHLSKIERGEKYPSVELLFVMADRLHMPLEEFFKETGTADASSKKGVKARLEIMIEQASPAKAKLILEVAQKILAADK